MNRLVTFLCMISLLAFHTSCNDNAMELGTPGAEVKTRAADQRVQNLIRQAREGNVEAYKSLALCYRDGDSVEQSWLNVLCMYAIYSQKTGGNFENIVELFDEEHPFRLLAEIVASSSINEKTETKLELLKQVAPTEAKAIEIVREASSKEEMAMAMNQMRKAEDEGSELAVVFQAIYYNEAKDKTGQEECLIRISEKHPFFNLLLGDVYIKRYEDGEDFSNIQKAIECYYKADAYGMLIPRYANTLLRMYKRFGEKGLLKCNDQEMERLKILGKRVTE